MAKRKQKTGYIRGTATHRRTETDYMNVMLDAVSVEDWRDVVTKALAAAKSGDPSARAWLAHYIVGRPVHKAPAPLNVVVQQLNGTDAVVDRLSRTMIDRGRYSPDREGDWETQVRTAIAQELAKKFPHVETIENTVVARIADESTGN
jgi:hypothetical protein